MFIGLNYAPERTGIAPYTAGMADRLSSEGDVVHVLTAFPHYPEWRFTQGPPPRRRQAVEHGVVVERRRHRLPRRGSSASRLMSEVSFGLRAASASWSCADVVVLVSPALFANLVVLPRLLLTRTPFVVWVQDLYGSGIRETGEGAGSRIIATFVSRIESSLLRSASAVVAIHEQMASSIAGLGVDRGHISVVRNWSHVQPAPTLDRAAVRQSFGWRPEETIVLHSGNMGQKQDLLNVIGAARIADHEAIPVRFVLVGDGAERPALEEAARGIGAVQIMPPVSAEDYSPMLAAADVLLVNEHPGMRSMALPSKLTSYFSSGRPVLAATSDESATAAELQRSGTGERVDPGDPAALVRSVQRLAADPELMHRLAVAALEYRRTTLTLDGAARAFRAVLSRTVPARRTASNSSPSTAGR